MEPKRFLVVEGSQSAHCCFDYTVVDSTRKVMIGPKWNQEWYDGQYEAICECFDKKDAERIAQALNAMETPFS